MELTAKEKQVLKDILVTELSEAEEIIDLDSAEQEQLKEYYSVVKSILNKL